ncbi:hypothetical protein C8R44DRAFT_731601 [Mycena epipterygia]|nr:hypothetical protein C8R44DRAFT_731601 [Mycena epipterygia]
MCRKHCNSVGSCSVPSHESERRKKLESAHTDTTTPTLSTTGLAFGGEAPFTSYDDILQYTLAPFQALQSYQDQLEESHTTKSRHLDQRLELAVGMYKSPTPRAETSGERFKREAREADDLELALRLSQEEYTPSTSSTSSTGSRLRTLSPSPVLPAYILPHPALGQAQAPDVPTQSSSSSPTLGRALAPDVTGRPSSSLSKTRLPAASVHKPAAPLRITTQLNEMWMASNGGPQVLGVPRDTAAQLSTLYVKKTVARRPIADTRQVHRFTLVFIDEGEKPPTVICVDDCPSWPSYVLDEPTITWLGLGPQADGVDLYSPPLRMFIGITLQYVHTVSTDSVILLRRPGVGNVDDIVTTFFPKTKLSHLRYNLPNERAAVLSNYKKATNIEDSDSDIEIISDPEVEIVSSQRVIKQEAGASPPRQRPCLVIDTSVGVQSSAPSSSSSTPSSRFLSMTPSTSTSTPPTTPILSPAPVWSRGLYVVDMAPGFVAMRSTKLKEEEKDSSRHFKRAFGQQYVYHKGTYQDNTWYWWSLASPAMRQEGIDAGRTSAGLWSEFR